MNKIPAFNNNYHKFTKVGTTYCVIKALGQKYILYPDKDKNYIFNTKEISKFLFDYKDAFNYDESKIDTNQSKEVNFDIEFYYKPLFSDKPENRGTDTFKATFFNGVFQRWERPFVCDGIVNLSDEKMPYFEAYPFEYSKVQGNDVKRVLVDDGTGRMRDNIDLDKLRIIRSQCCDGFYLKWHNNKWGYSYYLFDRIGQEKISPKSIGRLKEQFSWTYNRLELGKTGQREIKLFKQVDYTDRELMKSLMTSNEVYLYTGKKGQKATANDWLEVQVKGGVNETNKDNSFKQVVTLILPQEQTRKRI